jgi:hypothetical protein
MDNNRETFDKSEPVFYYSRERRLANAPKRVRDWNNAPPPKKATLFRSLTDTKPKALMLITIAALCAIILFMTYLRPALTP